MAGGWLRRRASTVDEIWADLEEGLRHIYRRESMLPNRYMQLYTYVYDFCTCVSVGNQVYAGNGLPTQQHQAMNVRPMSHRVGRPAHSRDNAPIHPPQPSQNQSQKAGGADFVGIELYNKLKAFILEFVKGVLAKSENLMGEDLLRYFVREWDQFRFCSKVVDGIFAYLNRHWIRREQEEGKGGVFTVYILALVLWKEQLQDHMKSSVSSAVLELIEKERQGIAITSQLIKGAIECFEELGFTEIPEQPTLDTLGKGISETTRTADPLRLRVYKNYFETRFLAVTESFYMKEAEDFLEKYPVTEFLKKVERRLGEEQTRCEMYLNSATQRPLAQCIEKVLITRQLELFRGEFCKLLEDLRDEDLGRMYKLCERVENGLDDLRQGLETHISQQGTGAISKVADQASQDARLYVMTLLEVHGRYAKLVAGPFNNDAGFVQALDKAATNFINRNAVTQGVPPYSHQPSTSAHTNNSSKSPELLARYCDQVLRKSTRNSEDIDIEDLLQQVMIIFKYIEDKDVFQKFYTKMFAKRLIGESSASDEAEGNIITKLKTMCGYEYTNKMQKMFTDTGLSKEMTEKFREHNQANNVNLKCDFSVMVLSAGAWPQQQITAMNIPPRLTNCMEAFKAFYNGMHSGRKLTWIYGQSRGELTAHGWSKKFTFVALTSQMAVLLLFNDNAEMSFDEIADAMQFKKDQLSTILASLIKAEILLAPEDWATSKSFLKFSLNHDYFSKKLKVDLSKSVMRQEPKQEQAEIQQNVDDNRKMVIQAAIVRIMKTRKRIQHQNLMTEVISQLSSRFKPKIPMVKKCIDTLIEKEYMQRDKGCKDTYEYLA